MKDELILNNLNLIYFVLRKMNLYDKRNDYYDIGLIGLVKAANKFDPDKGYKFNTWAVQCIRSEILQDIRKGNALTRRANINPISLELPTGITNNTGTPVLLIDTIDSGFDLEAYVIHREQTELLNKAISTLTDREKMILKYKYCKDMSQAEIADEIGVSQAHISRLLKQIIEKLKRKVRKGEKI